MIAIAPSPTPFAAPNTPFAANLTLAAGMTVTLLAAHQGLVRFNPILGSKDLAEAINQARRRDTRNQPATGNQQADLVVLDGELTSGSTLVFYTRQQVHLIDGRVNGLWYGSFWPDAPRRLRNRSLASHPLVRAPRHIFLLHLQRRRTPEPTSHRMAIQSACPRWPQQAARTILTNF